MECGKWFVCRLRYNIDQFACQKYDYHERVSQWQVEYREKKDDPDSNLEEWQKIYAIEWYGREGMSLDDSVVESNKEIYQPKMLPWHQQEADGYIYILDKTQRVARQPSHDKKGRPPTRQIYCDKKTAVSTQKLVKGLPIGLYNRCWLDGLTTTDRWKLSVSDSNLKLKWIDYQKIGDRNSS